MMCRYLAHMLGSSFSDQFEGGSIMSSSGYCGSDPVASYAYSSATSLAVSITAQKKGGDSIYSICRAFGIIRHIRAPFISSRTYEKFKLCPFSTTIPQYPSLMPGFENTMSPSSAGALETASIRRGSTPPQLIHTMLRGGDRCVFVDRRYFHPKDF